METVRTFIAVDIGDEIRETLDGLQRKLKKVHANVRWVKPRSMHLTLAFLGDLPVEKIPPLKIALDEAVQGQKPFEIEVIGTGFFGRPNRPRVIWAGIADAPPLMELQCKTIDAIQAAEIEFDSKPFSPHLTLGRVKGTEHTESLLGKLEKFKSEPLGQTTVHAIEVMQSRLKPGGAEYSTLHRQLLNA